MQSNPPKYVTYNAINITKFRKDLNQAIYHSLCMTINLHHVLMAWKRLNEENDRLLHQAQQTSYTALARENEQLRLENEHLWSLLEQGETND